MLILGSSSPRRRELLALITPDFTVHTGDVDESTLTAPTPVQLAQVLALASLLYPGRSVARLMPGHNQERAVRFLSFPAR